MQGAKVVAVAHYGSTLRIFPVQVRLSKQERWQGWHGAPTLLPCGRARGVPAAGNGPEFSA